jgi:hypothetical protein
LKDCTPALFDELESHRHIEASYKPSLITLAALTDDTTKIQTEPFKQWHLEFANHRGQDGVCMGYMFREGTLVPPDEEDDDETNYPNRDAELMNRCPMLPDGEDPDPIRPHFGPFTPEVQADMRVMAAAIVRAIGKTRALTFAQRGIESQNALAPSTLWSRISSLDPVHTARSCRPPSPNSNSCRTLGIRASSPS